MDKKYILGVFIFLFSLFMLLFFLITRIKKLIKIIKYKYIEVDGIVIKSIDFDKNQEKENKKLLENSEVARTMYSVLNELDKDGYKKNYDHNKYMGKAYVSVIQYEVDNKKYEIVSKYGSDTKEKINTKHKVRYNPENPNDAFITDDRFLFPLFFILLFFIVGVLIVFRII